MSLPRTGLLRQDAWTGQDGWEQMQKAARSDPDCRGLDREACQVLHHLLPATSRLGGCHGKRPFSTIGDK